MSTHVVNELHALPDQADDVLNLLIELSPVSRTRPGCEAIFVRRNRDDPTVLIGDTRWATRLDYDNYLAWRTESGYTASASASASAARDKPTWVSACIGGGSDQARARQSS